jgi:hypothetical protein
MNIRDGCNGCNGCNGYEEVTKKRTFLICSPHEGPEQYEFTLECVMFSDGINRFIYKSEIVPEAYFPKMVYIFNFLMGSYEHVGCYNKTDVYTLIERETK